MSATARSLTAQYLCGLSSCLGFRVILARTGHGVRNFLLPALLRVTRSSRYAYVDSIGLGSNIIADRFIVICI